MCLIRMCGATDRFLAGHAGKKYGYGWKVVEVVQAKSWQSSSGFSVGDFAPPCFPMSTSGAYLIRYSKSGWNVVPVNNIGYREIGKGAWHLFSNRADARKVAASLKKGRGIFIIKRVQFPVDAFIAVGCPHLIDCEIWNISPDKASSICVTKFRFVSGR